MNKKTKKKKKIIILWCIFNNFYYPNKQAMVILHKTKKEAEVSFKKINSIYRMENNLKIYKVELQEV